MPRISGVNIAESKRVEIGLSYIFGVGTARAKQILKTVGIKDNPKFSELNETEVDKIRKEVEKEPVETDLRQITQQNIRRLKEIGAYRGNRHIRNLPVHGQRTKTNARTKRGKKVTVGSGRKKAAEKT